MPARFELVSDSTGKFHFDLRAPDGGVLLSSLPCDSKIAVEDDLIRARNALRDASRIVAHHRADDRHFVVIKARDGSVLARSAQVASDSQLTELTDQICAAAANAPLADLTVRLASPSSSASSTPRAVGSPR